VALDKTSTGTIFRHRPGYTRNRNTLGRAMAKRERRAYETARDTRHTIAPGAKNVF
jgi:hypothetical protein